VGANAFAHESGIHQDGMLKEKTTYEIMSPETIGLKESKLVLGKHSGRHAFREKLVDLGYALSDDQVNTAFAKFKDLADRKKQVADEDIRVIIEEKLIETPQTYVLGALQVAYGNQTTPTATVSIKTQDGALLEEHAEGNGSVDAIYNAIDFVTKEEVELEDYSIKSVSHGKDALGEVHVVLRQKDVSVQGRGVSTDILEASAKAYLDAVNRLVERRNTGSGSRSNVTLI
jgi:2-isopropylmalate synthase